MAAFLLHGGDRGRHYRHGDCGMHAHPLATASSPGGREREGEGGTREECGEWDERGGVGQGWAFRVGNN